MLQNIWLNGKSHDVFKKKCLIKGKYILLQPKGHIYNKTAALVGTPGPALQHSSFVGPENHKIYFHKQEPVIHQRERRWTAAGQGDDINFQVGDQKSSRRAQSGYLGGQEIKSRGGFMARTAWRLGSGVSRRAGRGGGPDHTPGICIEDGHWMKKNVYGKTTLGTSQ